MGATPPTVYSDSFETSLVYWSWSEDIHVVIIESSDYFRKLNFVIFEDLYITKLMDRGYLVGATSPTVLYRFFRNFTGVLITV